MEPEKLTKEALLKHYGQDFVQKAILDNSVDKEVVGSYGGKGYARRPDVLNYPADILELVKNGITSFHSSEEIWKNPLLLDPEMKKSEVENIRKGWDLVLDIDCKWLEYSQMAADLLYKALKYQGIKAVSVKFSGNHGFHLGVPFESFPEQINGRDTRKMFPEAPRRVAEYLKHLIKKPLGKAILESEQIGTIIEKTGKPSEELIQEGELNPFVFLEIDTILISPRHLCRMVYSVNEKSGWISIPVDPSKILEFDTATAKIGTITSSSFDYLDRSVAELGEASKMFQQAFDFKPAIEDEEYKITHEKEYSVPSTAVPEDFFPPCIKHAMQGMPDGKKRFLFIFVNFLVSLGWEYDQIDEMLKKWNAKNDDQLREVMLKGQIRYHKQMKKKILPPNCDNKMYYVDLGLCKPDGLCKKIKNPAQYSKLRVLIANNPREEGSTKGRKLTDEEKEQRRQTREKHKKFKEDMLKKREEEKS